MTVGPELTNDNIGKITVQARVSFVAVDLAKGEAALNILSGGRVKKQRVRAHLVEPASRTA